MNGIDRPEVFVEKIGYVRKGPMGVPRLIQINLATVIADQPYDLSGNLFYIWSAPDRDDYVNIKVNETNQPAIPYRMGQGLKTPFDRLLITTPAGQTGTMYLIYGTEAPDLLEIIDNRSALSGNISDMLAEMQGDILPERAAAEITVGAAQVELLAASATRKAFSLCADIDNTGVIYLGFDNTVTTPAGGNIWFHCMPAGAQYGIDDYRGPIHAIATAAGQLIGVGEW